MGRAYFGDVKGLRELATVLFIGGLIYIPLYLYEIRLSPQLHNTIYGFHQHDFSPTLAMVAGAPRSFYNMGWLWVC